jgi:tetratricopeptide (TPR) repeat protein
LAILGVLLASVGARADPVSELEGRRKYEQGRAAFERRDFQLALERFKEAYLLTSAPALLFNMASALQELGRPSEAAETLKAYLRVRPDDPDRPAIEERIRALAEKARLLEPPRAPPPPAPAVRSISPPLATPPHTSRRGLAIGLSIAAAAATIIAVGLAVGLTVHAPPQPTLGTQPGTL